MSERIKNVILMMIALLLGLFLYVLFRPQTYIAKAAIRLLSAEGLHNFLNDRNYPFLSFYLPDFLWAFSLTCGLQAIFLPSPIGSAWCGGTALLCGIVWEICQRLALINGTGDIVDVLMYFSGACVCVILNLKEKRHEKD